MATTPQQNPGGGLLRATGNLSTNPLFNLGIGLLSGAQPGGTFAGGAQMGLLNMQRAAEMQQQQQVRDLQMQQIRAKQADAERQRQVAESMAAQYDQPTPYQYDTLPTGDPVPPGLLTGSPTPQNQMTADLIRANPQGFADRMFDQLMPSPTEAPDKIQQIQMLRQMYPNMSEQQILDRVYSGGVNVEVSTPGAELRSLPEQFMLDYSSDLGARISSEATQAPQERRQMQQGKEYLRALVQGGDPTGAWLPIKAEAARWLGTDENMVGGYQMFMNLAGQKVMDTIQQTKGAVSEKEMSYFEKINIGADKEPFTNYALMEIADRSAARKQDMARVYPQYLAQNPTSGGMGFEQWYLDTQDPFPEFDLDQLRRQYTQDIEGKEPADADLESWARGRGYVD